MAQVTIPIGAAGTGTTGNTAGVRWPHLSPNRLLIGEAGSSPLFANQTTRYLLDTLDINAGFDCDLRITRSQTESNTADGPDFTPAWEERGVGAIRITLAGVDYGFEGPNGPNVTSFDDTERYIWGLSAADNLTRIALRNAWAAATAAQRLAVTATFDDGVPTNAAPTAVGTIPDQSVDVGASGTVDVAANFDDPDGDALTYAAVSSATGRATVTVAGSVVTFSGVSAGTATITVTAEDPSGESVGQGFTVTVSAVVPPFVLADIAIPAGRQLVGTTQGSLLESANDIQAGTTGDLFASGDTVVDGDDPVDLGDTGLSITVIRYRSADNLQISENGAGDFEALYSAGGAYEDRALHIQVDADTVVTLEASAIDAGGSSANRIRWGLTAQQRTDLQSLDTGSRFIHFITEAATGPLDDADAPTVAIDPIADGDEGTDVELSATLGAGGTYDGDVEYAWVVAAGALDDDTSANPTWTRPAVTADTDYDADLTITVRGTGTDAADGTSDTATAATVTATVRDVPPPSTGPAYNEGLAVVVAGTPTAPLRGALRLRRSLSDGSKLSFRVRGIQAGLAHVQRGVAVEVTDTASSTLLFSGNILHAEVVKLSGGGTLVDIDVQATGFEQRLYSHLLTASDARDVNNAATVSGQLAELVTVAGTGYSSGSVDPNVNRLDGVGPGASVGTLLRGMGDVQRVQASGAIDLIVRSGLVSAAIIERAHVRIRASNYRVSLDTALRRVIALGAPVKFIAAGTLQRVADGGVTRAVATVTTPADTEVRSVGQVVARQAVAGKFAIGDQLDGVWDPDANRFEWSGVLAAGESALVGLHGAWRTEDVVTAPGADTLARDTVLEVPVTNTAQIRGAANRLLDQRRLPVELLNLPLLLGAAVPRVGVGDAVQVAEMLQTDMDVHQANAADLWLVHEVTLTQPGLAQAAVVLGLSRRLPDFRTRDFYAREAMRASGGRQIVIGSGAGAPQIAQVIPAQSVKVGEPAVTIGLGDYFSDPDGDMLAYVATSSDVTRATVAVAGSVLTIEAVAEGNVTATVTASDATRSAAQLFAVAVVTNRAPVLDSPLPDRSAYVGHNATIINLDNYFSDADGDALTYAAATSDAATATATIGNGILTVRGEAVGQAVITVTATDPGGLTASDTIEATTEAVPPAPAVPAGINVTVGFAGRSLQASWDAVSGATGYRIDFDYREGTDPYTSRWSSSPIGSNSLSWNTGLLLPSGSYTFRFRVRARAGPTLGPWSAYVYVVRGIS